MFHPRYHGIWGDKYTWNQFESLLQGENQRFTVIKADYSGREDAKYNNAGPFSQNYSVIGESITNALGAMSNVKLAATQVDIVAHSMGGLLVREYCRQDEETCKQTIHKLITIDTPFQGTELVRLLRDVRDRENVFFHPKEYILLKKLQTSGCIPEDSVCRPLGGAIDDLIPGSDALRILPELPIPTHPIIGLAKDGVWGHDPVITALWHEGLAVIFKYVPDQTFPLDTGCGTFHRSRCRAFFGAERNDRIVSQGSQSGGVSGNGQHDNMSGVDHITVHDNSDVAWKVSELLEARPDDSRLFIQVLPRAP